MNDYEAEIMGILIEYHHPTKEDYLTTMDASDLIKGIFKEWALDLMMNSHADSCSLYKGEQTGSCNCSVDDIINRFAQRVEEEAR